MSVKAFAALSHISCLLGLLMPGGLVTADLGDLRHGLIHPAQQLWYRIPLETVALDVRQEPSHDAYPDLTQFRKRVAALRSNNAASQGYIFLFAYVISVLQLHRGPYHPLSLTHSSSH
jgi:hypothetical protein